MNNALGLAHPVKTTFFPKTFLFADFRCFQSIRGPNGLRVNNCQGLPCNEHGRCEESLLVGVGFSVSPPPT
jgi:hypothetical protein